MTTPAGRLRGALADAHTHVQIAVTEVEALAVCAAGRADTAAAACGAYLMRAELRHIAQLLRDVLGELPADG